MKRALLPIALLLGLFAGSGSAVAAPPTPAGLPPGQFDCPGFKVDAVFAGKVKVIDAPLSAAVHKKSIRILTSVSAAGSTTLTGPPPASKELSYSLNGSVRIALVLSPELDIVMTATGRNLISDPKHGDYPGGLFLTVGKVVWSLNAPDYPNGGLTGPGKIADVCALLAP